MKIKIFFIPVALGLCLLVLITSCQNKPSQECIELKAANEQLSSNIKMYEDVWNDIINKREIEKINETSFDKNITLISSPENIVGIKGFKDYYQNYLTGFSDVTFTIVDAFGQSDKIVKHWNFKGKHTGVFFGIPATGKVVNVYGVTLVKMKDGKIVQEQDFMDNLEFMQQLEIIPRQ
uniref:ester cyclase n=1 Tax=Daejeonella sp. TaxID=2805397 RepID=UPI00404B1CDC